MIILEHIRKALILVGIIAGLLLLWQRHSHAQGGMMPGPGTVHSIGGGGTVAFDAKTAAYTNTATTTFTMTNLTVGAGSGRALAIPIIFELSTVPSGLACVWDAVGANQSLTTITGTNSGTNGGLSGSAITLGLIAPVSGNKNLTCSWTGSAAAHAVAVSFTGVNQGSIGSAFPNGNFVSNVTAVAGPLQITFTSGVGHMVLANFGQDCTGWGAISGTTIATDIVTGPAIGVASNYDTGASPTKILSAAYTGTCVGVGSGTDVSP